MYRNDGGYTLIEILISLAIIGVLVGVLVPIVGEYRLRATLADLGQAHSKVSNALAIYYSEQSAWPNFGDSEKNLVSIGLDSSENYSDLISTLTLADGAVVSITLINADRLGALSGKSYRLEPIETNPVRFECVADDEIDRLLGPFCVPR